MCKYCRNFAPPPNRGAVYLNYSICMGEVLDILKRILKGWILPANFIKYGARVRFYIQHLTLSAEYKRFLCLTTQLKNRHVGSRCFLLGAGSSISAQDISKLEGEFVISMSNTFVHPDFKKIKPKYHVVPPLMSQHSHLHSEADFILWLQDMEKSTGSAEIFFHIGDKGMIDKNFLFKNRIVHWVNYGFRDNDISKGFDLRNIPSIWSVSELALFVAVYMGFDSIYTIGIDHDWFIGSMVYFYDPQKDHKLKLTPNDLSFADSEFQMRRHAEIFSKYKQIYRLHNKIFNANSNSNHYLDVFPKVDYDSLFNK